MAEPAPASVIGEPIRMLGIIVNSGLLTSISSSFMALRFTSASVSVMGISSPEFQTPPTASSSSVMVPKAWPTTTDVSPSLWSMTAEVPLFASMGTKRLGVSRSLSVFVNTPVFEPVSMSVTMLSMAPTPAVETPPSFWLPSHRSLKSTAAVPSSSGVIVK